MRFHKLDRAQRNGSKLVVPYPNGFSVNLATFGTVP